MVKNGQIQVAEVFKHPQISTLVREHGRENVKKIVTVMLDDFVNAFKTDNKITPAEYSNVVSMILSDFYHFRLEDFAIFFGRAKTGAYGTIYNRLDQEVIFGMIERYDQQRVQTRDNIHDEEKAQPKQPLTPDMAEEFYESFKLRDKEKKKTGINSSQHKKFIADYNKDPKGYMEKLKKGKI